MAEIDTYRCRGCGACLEADPELVRENELTGLPELDPDAAEAAGPERLEALQALCPEKCIHPGGDEE